MRDQRFTFLCSSVERQLLIDLAERLQRSQGDTVRYLIRRFSAEFLHGEIRALTTNDVVGKEKERVNPAGKDEGSTNAK